MKRRKPQQSLHSRVCGQTCVTLSGDFCCDGEHLLFSVSWEFFLWKISRRHSWPKNVMCCQSSPGSCVGGSFSYSPTVGGTNGMAPVLHSSMRPWVLESWGWFQQKLLRHGIWNKAVNLCSKYICSHVSCVFFVTNVDNALELITLLYNSSNLIGWAAFWCLVQQH